MSRRSDRDRAAHEQANGNATDAALRGYQSNPGNSYGTRNGFHEARLARERDTSWETAGEYRARAARN